MSKYFSNEEMRCHCRRPECDAAPMKEAFLQKLDALREEWGKALIPTSARRCRYQNVKVGGAPASQHLIGNACDFVFSRSSSLMEFVMLAEKHGFQGIGIGRRLVHLDDRKQRARWTYST